MSDPLDAVATALREHLLRGRDGADEAGGPDAIRLLVDREAGLLHPDQRDELARRIAERSFGLGPLEALLADPEVDEIMVSGTALVWVERAGRLERTDTRFATEEELRHTVERILAPLGRRVDEAQPLVDARLPDGCARAQRSARIGSVATRKKSQPIQLAKLEDVSKPLDGYIG